jgi:hypothetical protein
MDKITDCYSKGAGCGSRVMQKMSSKPEKGGLDPMLVAVPVLLCLFGGLDLLKLAIFNIFNFFFLQYRFEPYFCFFIFGVELFRDIKLIMAERTFDI